MSGLVWCRTYDSASVANGANVADCLFSNDSSYHCDNSNFSGCYGKAQVLTDPVKSNPVSCSCVPTSPSPTPPPTYPPPSYGVGGGGGIGCSVADKRLIRKSSQNSCYCVFRTNPIAYYGYTDYGTIGELIQPVQDFWSHSNSIFVPNCKRVQCVSWAIVCLDWECAEYNVEVKFPNTYIPSGTEAEGWGLFSGLYGAGGWSTAADFACTRWFSGFTLNDYPPCNVKKKIMTHCMLNKDSAGNPDRDCMSACDQGDWPGDCGGPDSIQKNVYWDVRNKAIQATKAYLTSFCFQVGAYICQ